MSLSDPRIVYGVHSISPYNRTTKLPYGILKVIGSANLALTSDLEQLFAGSNKFAWAAENKTVSTELTAKVKAYPGFLFSLFLGATVTDATSDTAGTISTLTNQNGTSLKSATTGIASVAIKSAQKANLKFGKYILKVLTSTTVGVYLLSDIDITRGTDVSYTDDNLGLTLAGGTVTITSATGTDLDDLGITLNGGSGTIGMTVGDTATFEVLPPSTKSSSIVVGQSTDTFPAFGALLLSQKRATGEMFEIDAHNCVGGGLPINMEENAFSQPELKMACLYDSTLNRVFSIRHIMPS
jgi:hypothetical protein